MGMLAGCGSNNSNTGTANAGSTNAESKTDASESADAAGTESTGNIDTADLAGTQITMLNSKGEIQTALEDMAEAFKEDTGIELEVSGMRNRRISIYKSYKRIQLGNGTDDGDLRYHRRCCTCFPVCS